MQAQPIQRIPLPKKCVPLLLVSADENDRVALQSIFESSRWKLRSSSSYRDALENLRQDRIPVVICDADSMQADWRLLLSRLADLPRPPMLIVSSRLSDERLWAEVLNLGGHDLLLTPFDRTEVLRSVFSAWQFWRRQTVGHRLASEMVA